MLGKKKVVAPPPDQLCKDLARRGPHPVDRGDLGIVGIPGSVYAPRTGTGLPAVAFGHAWRTDSAAYRDLMYHLASWGIVVATPDSERGIMASDIELATDLRAALTVTQSVSLGVQTPITVDAANVGLVGHGFGAAAAVYAASDRVLLGRPQIPVKALAALFPAPTTDDLLPAATKVTAPSLVLAAPDQLDSMNGNALILAKQLGDDVVLRTVPGSTNRGLLEHRSIKSLIGVNGAEKATHKTVRTQLTGYLLATLTGDPTYAAFADPEAIMPSVTAVDLGEARPADAGHVAQLLGVPAYTDDGGKRLPFGR
ncbi:MAG: alpha/beta hydrolase [Gordonia sp. (in: high G+C Gram-positive bacteria)]|uniref:dienelactone hydrolase family protein n=1 Tax=Gordonia sp. (in: high G+C Gram-positive bacteria) TaxID=84139 RepID=UPI0039E30F08